MRRLISVASLCICTAAATPVGANETETIGNAFKAAFGKPVSGIRSLHAKGQCVVGTFVSSPEAKSVTTALAFDAPVIVLGRFSIGGGNPLERDTSKLVVRGFSFRINPDAFGTSDFAFISTPMHVAANLKQFIGYMESRRVNSDGPDPAKMKAFSDANPNTKAQAAYLGSRPVPGSYVGVNYWGVHAYQAKNDAGATRVIKLRLVPKAEVGLSDEEAKAKPDDFLMADLTERLEKEPQTFTLVAIPGEPGDRTDDLSTQWAGEDKRKTIPLGQISIIALEPNETCDADFFDPTTLGKGLAPSPDDTLFAPRSPFYAISHMARTKK